MFECIGLAPIKRALSARMRYWLTLAIAALATDVTGTEVAGTLRLSVPDDGYPPYVVLQDGEPQGSLIEPLRQAAQRAGIALEFVLLPELRSHHMLESGNIDGRMESPDWTENPDDYLWSNLMVRLEDVLVYRNDQPFNPEQGDGLLGGEIITHLGYVYPLLQPAFANGSLIRLDKLTEQDMLNTLLLSQAETARALIIGRDVAQWYLAAQPALQALPLTFSEKIYGCAPMGFQFVRNPRVQALVQRLNKEFPSLPPRCPHIAPLALTPSSANH
ncbi:MAG: hypothetical protein LRY66_14585 [Saccharospirillaceae bacterium]|nr:hypothetical protein [Saccharospirillaceae bacterium]MCD8532534.1 hypothetical protein [Saccharospirillaceae bacterium]